MGTARRRRIGTILASGSPFSVSVYARPCRRPRVTEPESATNWRTLMSVGCSSAIGKEYHSVPHRSTDAKSHWPCAVRARCVPGRTVNDGVPGVLTVTSERALTWTGAVRAALPGIDPVALPWIGARRARGTGQARAPSPSARNDVIETSHTASTPAMISEGW